MFKDKSLCALRGRGEKEPHFRSRKEREENSNQKGGARHIAFLPEYEEGEKRNSHNNLWGEEKKVKKIQLQKEKGDVRHLPRRGKKERKTLR